MLEAALAASESAKKEKVRSAAKAAARAAAAATPKPTRPPQAAKYEEFAYRPAGFAKRPGLAATTTTPSATTTTRTPAVDRERAAPRPGTDDARGREERDPSATRLAATRTPPSAWRPKPTAAPATEADVRTPPDSLPPPRDKPPPVTQRRESLGGNPGRVARRMSFDDDAAVGRDGGKRAAAAAAETKPTASPLAPHNRLKITVGELEGRGAEMRKLTGENSLEPPSTRRSATTDAMGAGLVSSAAAGTTATTKRHDPFAFTDEAKTPRMFGPFASAARNAAANAATNATHDATALAVTPAQPPRTPGLTNLGNTCYLNATLQVLCGLECFARDTCADALARAPFADDSVYYAMRKLVKARKEKEANARRLKVNAAADAAVGLAPATFSYHTPAPGAKGAPGANQWSLSPAEVKRAVTRRHRRYEGYAQHDAHEFLCECIDALEEEVTRMYRVGELDAGAASGGVPAPAPSMAMAAAVGAYKRKAAAEATTPEQTLPKRATGEDGPPATATANDAAAATTTTPDPAPSAGATIVPLHRTLCPTRRNFTTAVAATLTCDACGDTCVKHETFRHLSVEIPVGTGGGAAAAASAAANLGAVPLESLLNGFFAAETLERTCEKPGCDGKRATLSRKIVRLPRVLVVHLKRFRLVESLSGANDENADADVVLGKHAGAGALRMAKIVKRVALPMKVSLANFASGDALKGPPPRASTDANADADASPAASPADARIAKRARLLGDAVSGSDDDSRGAGATRHSDGELSRVAWGANDRSSPNEDDESEPIDEASAAVNHFRDDGSLVGAAARAQAGAYRLRGIISHIGSTLDQGHYLAHVRTDDETWVSFDDEDVKDVETADVFKGGMERECYVATYALE